MQKKFTKILFFSFAFLMLPNFVFAANIYVDKTLAADCSGDYSTTNRTCTESSGNDAYNTVQEAVIAVSAGDTIYMRGGTYGSADLNPGDATYHVKIPNNKQGTEENRITMTSYPNEWAVLDGEYAKAWSVLSYSMGSQEICPMYWTFSKFEIMRGGASDYSGRGGGIMLRTSAHNIFEYLYIHDNRSNGSENDGGISLQNEAGAEAPQYNTIQFCYLKDNGDPANWNTGNIVLLGDYKEPDTTSNAVARKRNIIQYNYMVGGYKGIKSKNDQFLTMDNTGANTTYEEDGDKVHHNIILEYAGVGIESRQDFQQIYSNIISSSLSQNAIMLGSNKYDTDREPFYNCIYNNIVKGGGISVLHQGNEMYSPPYHPYVYIFNNILDTVGSRYNIDGDPSYARDLNITPGPSGSNDSCLTWSTVHIANNLFWPRASADTIIYACVNADPYTPASLASAGYATDLWANSTAGLHPGTSGADQYKTTGSFVLNGSTTIANGGIGGNHPYLSGVTIPSYVGATNPNDNGWVDDVMSFATLTDGVPVNLKSGMTVDLDDGTPGESDTTPPNAPSGLSVS